MSEDNKPKAAKAAPKPRLKKGSVLELRGFPYPITDELLQGPHGSLHIRSIQNWERENNAGVLGTLIVMD
jgi:hypothetical protein